MEIYSGKTDKKILMELLLLPYLLEIWQFFSVMIYFTIQLSMKMPNRRPFNIRKDCKRLLIIILGVMSRKKHTFGLHSEILIWLRRKLYWSITIIYNLIEKCNSSKRKLTHKTYSIHQWPSSFLLESWLTKIYEENHRYDKTNIVFINFLIFCIVWL